MSVATLHTTTEHATAGSRQLGGRFWKQSSICGIVVALTLATFDLSLRLFLEPQLVEEPIDIQTLLQLEAKLNFVANFQGVKVVLLGDSVILGHSLREANDPEWREHHLAPLLKRRLEEKYPDQPVLVMNLALNGALPADLDRMVEKVLPTKPDLIVLDVGLRGFSADFSRPEQQYSRTWLRPPVPKKKAMDRLLARVRNKVDQTLEQGSAHALHTPAVRDLAGACYLSGSVRQSLGQLRDQGIHAWAALADEPLDDLDDNELELVLKARDRFASIRLATTNPQSVALGSMLQRLQKGSQKALIFYARENPDLRDEVIKAERYHELRAELDSFIQTIQGPGLRYVPGVPSLTSDVYLDLVHVDAEGYQRMMTHLWPEIDRLMDSRMAEVSQRQ